MISLQKDLVVSQRCFFVQRSVGPRGERSTIRGHDGETINDWRIVFRPISVLNIVDGHCSSRCIMSGLIVVAWLRLNHLRNLEGTTSTIIFNSTKAYHSLLLTAESELYGVVDCGVWRIRDDD